MKKQHIEDTIRHEVKKWNHTITKILWEHYSYEVEPGVNEEGDDLVIYLKEDFTWKKLYRRFSRLETKLNKKYGVSLTLANE